MRYFTLLILHLLSSLASSNLGAQIPDFTIGTVDLVSRDESRETFFHIGAPIVSKTGSFHFVATTTPREISLYHFDGERFEKRWRRLYTGDFRPTYELLGETDDGFYIKETGAVGTNLGINYFFIPSDNGFATQLSLSRDDDDLLTVVVEDRLMLVQDGLLTVYSPEARGGVQYEIPPLDTINRNWAESHGEYLIYSGVSGATISDVNSHETWVLDTVASRILHNERTIYAISDSRVTSFDKWSHRVDTIFEVDAANRFSEVLTEKAMVVDAGIIFPAASSFSKGVLYTDISGQVLPLLEPSSSDTLYIRKWVIGVNEKQGNLYFVRKEIDDDTGLWETDGTADGTRLVQTFTDDFRGDFSSIVPFTLDNGEVYLGLGFSGINGIYYLDPSRMAESLVFIEGSNVFRSYSTDFYPLRDRLIAVDRMLGGNTNVLEVGPSGVTNILNDLDNDVELALVVENDLFFLQQDPWGGGFIYTTHQTEPLLTIDRYFGDDIRVKPRMMSFGGRSFLYRYEEDDGGVGLYEITAPLDSPVKVTDPFPGTLGLEEFSAQRNIYLIDTFLIAQARGRNFFIVNNTLQDGSNIEALFGLARRISFGYLLTNSNEPYEFLVGNEPWGGGRVYQLSASENEGAYYQPVIYNDDVYYIRVYRSNLETRYGLNFLPGNYNQETLFDFATESTIPGVVNQLLATEEGLFLTLRNTGGEFELYQFDLDAGSIGLVASFGGGLGADAQLNEYSIDGMAILMAANEDGGGQAMIRFADGQRITSDIPGLDIDEIPTRIGDDILFATDSFIIAQPLDGGELKKVVDFPVFRGSRFYPCGDDCIATAVESSDGRGFQLIVILPDLSYRVLDEFAYSIPYTEPIETFRGLVAARVPGDNVGKDLKVYDPYSDAYVSANESFGLFNVGDSYQSTDSTLYFFAHDESTGMEFRYFDFDPVRSVSGTLFFDQNANGVAEASEPGIKGLALSLSSVDQTMTIFPDQKGRYREAVPKEEEVTLTALESGCWELTAPPNVVIEATDIDDPIDFSYKLNVGGAPAVGIHTVIASPRCNEEVLLWITVRNSGCATIDTATLRVDLPELITLLDEGDLAPISLEDSLTYPVPTLNPGESVTFKLLLGLPDETFAGTPLLIESSVTAISRDVSEVLRGTNGISPILRCAYDPNDKQVSPSRPEPSASNYTLFEERLTYTVRFQNTGNDTAINVRIEDQLSSDLDWSTLLPVAASHAHSTSIDELGLVTFSFDNIYLVDSIANEPESHGFVSFSIEAKTNLEEFTTIRNDAAIFFDLNQPIITNKVRSTLIETFDRDGDGYIFYEECDDNNPAVNPSAAEVPDNGIDENCDGLKGFSTVSISDHNQPEAQSAFRLYPIPTNGVVTIAYEGRGAVAGQLYNLQGQLIRSFTFTGQGEVRLNDHPNGTYLLRLVSENSKRIVVRKLVKVR